MALTFDSVSKAGLCFCPLPGFPDAEEVQGSFCLEPPAWFVCGDASLAPVFCWPMSYRQLCF